MSLFLPVISTFEGLPDEILLKIYRYLSSIDILSAFYDLNRRLSQTISGYCQYVSLRQASYQQLTSICSSILVQIGLNIHSLIVSDEWQGLLSKVFLEHFGERMSSTFPYLKRLTLIRFTSTSFQLFLNCLKNLPELNQLDIRLFGERFHDEEESGRLLHQLFTANENRLTSIAFDDDSTPFFCQINDTNVSYPNIEKLTIKMDTLYDFHNLLTLLPRAHSLDVTIDEEYFQSSDDHQLLPACELKDFCLRSVRYPWNLEQLISVLKRIPNVQKLSIKISSTNDSRLLHGHEFFSQLSSLPLKIFNYTLFYMNCAIDKSTILSTWQRFRHELIYVDTDNIIGSMLCTLPCIISQLNLLYSSITAVVNSDLIQSCGSTVESLYLHNIPPRLAENYNILTKCRRMKHLNITIDTTVKPVSNRQIDLCKLPYLTSLILSNTPSMEPKDFPALIQAAPNLYDLTTDFWTLPPFFGNDCVRQLLGQRITHLKIIVKGDDIEGKTFIIADLASTFPHLKCLCFEGQYIIPVTVESLILAVFNHLPQWNSLISLCVLHIILSTETCAKGIHQWVLEHISAYGHHLFLTDYTNNIFRLWL